jgi:hypothetical protein
MGSKVGRLALSVTFVLDSQQLKHFIIIRMVARPADIAGKGSVSFSVLQVASARIAKENKITEMPTAAIYCVCVGRTSTDSGYGLRNPRRAER